MFTPTIGLEIHAELKTKSKMFCGCKNDPEEKRPNVNICPICLGHPGTLPTINKKAVELMLKIGLALGGEIALHSQFERKSYFYPDLPKGYQISQYALPLISNATLNGVRIRRIHLEEDTGKLIHGDKFSLVDFNRAGVPLMELVTEPDIKEAEEAVRFAESLQTVLRYLDASDADMEKGQMRVEVNISLSSSDVLGTKVEVKNINSFRAVYEAIQYEIKRQSELLSKGEKIIQETRGWDDIKKVTIAQRFKETAHDYRYFPEPDLPPLRVAEIFDLEEIKKNLPELPTQKSERFLREYNISPSAVAVLVKDKKLADFFEAGVSELKARNENADIQVLANYLLNDVLGILNQKGKTFAQIKISPEHLAHLVDLVLRRQISSRIAKDVLLLMMEKGEDPESLMAQENITLIASEDELDKIVSAVIASNKNAVDDYRKGKTNALEFLVGQVMRETKGKASPEVVREIVRRYLTAE